MLVLLLTVVLTAPSLPSALHVLADVSQATDPLEPVLATVACAAWLLVSALVLSAALVLASALPGVLGRAADALSRRVVPRAVRRGVEVVLGAVLSVGTVGALPAQAAPAAPAQAAPAQAAAAQAGDLDWPGSSGPVEPPVGDAVPGADAPGPADPTAARPADRQIVVVPGDTLWDLAATSLREAGLPTSDRAVATAWPTWWAANRAVIGPDPDLLLPGTALADPTPR